MTQQLIANRYELGKELGRGAFGVVYLATDHNLNRKVALKALHPSLVSRDEQFAARFKQEAQAIAALNHPAIVNVFDVIEHDGQYFIPMSYITGPTLRHEIRGNRRLSLDQALEPLHPLAEALDYAHQRGVIHRDIKPGNVILDQGRNGQPVLIDFGLAKALDESSTLTRAGVTLGTPEYMAPEQADSDLAAEIGPATDRYAFGILTYRLLTGQVPFSSDSSVAVAVAHIHKSPPVPTTLAPELPPVIDGILLRMLAKTPADRYARATTFVKELQAASDTARRGSQIAPLYAQLQAAHQRGDNSEVLVLGTKIEALQANYRDVSQLMAQARQRHQTPRPLSTAERLSRGLPGRVWTGGVVALVLVACLLGLGLREVGDLVSGTSVTATPTLAPTVFPTDTATSVATVTPKAPTSTPRLPTPTSTHAPTQVLLLPTHTSTPEPSPTRTRLPTFTSTLTSPPPTATDTPLPQTITPTPGLVVGSTRTRAADGMTLVHVPAGSFTMGSNDGEDDEKPPHPVRLDAFWLDQTEVTNAQYNRCVAAGNCPAAVKHDGFTGDDYPVVGVSWNNASAYCKWTGGRLPTEAEWEYAARGPEGNIYPWGNDSPTCGLAQFSECDGATIPSGSLPAGASWVGARDMAGNVWEWVADWYDSAYYQNSPENNPPGPQNGSYKLWRGGAWNNGDRRVRSAYRYGSIHPDFRLGNVVGFRCVVPPGN